jgi:hypothetical protein
MVEECFICRWGFECLLRQIGKLWNIWFGEIWMNEMLGRNRLVGLWTGRRHRQNSFDRFNNNNMSSITIECFGWKNAEMTNSMNGGNSLHWIKKRTFFVIFIHSQIFKMSGLIDFSWTFLIFYQKMVSSNFYN